MPRKEVQPKKDGEPNTNEPKKEDKPEPDEDPPIVKELKAIDDKYLEVEREYEKEVEELKKKYLERKKPVLEERHKLLIGDTDKPEGTPKCVGFWCKAMKNHPAFDEVIEEWDEPVLQYLRNVEWEPHEDNEHSFKLIFTFTENPYFEPLVLVKEYQVVESSPYNQEIDVKKTISTVIDWKPGKDVTVEKTTKKVKGGGAKKAKQKGKETIEPRPSMFRAFFRSLEEGGSLPDDLKAMMEMEDEDDDSDSGMASMFMETDYEVGCALKDQIIPFAVRWYTGEAAPEDDSSDDEDEESEDDDDDDDDEESEDETPKGKKGMKQKAGNKSKASPKMKPGDPKEECKQQ